MAVSSKSLTPQSTGSYEILDYAGVNMFALTCAVLSIVAFIFMPWAGREMSLNGARIMSDVMYDAVTTKGTLLILLLPLTALVAGGLALWGMVQPDRGKLVARLIPVTGGVGLIYYVAVFAGVVDSPVYDRGPGLGFWVGLVCLVAFILQLVLVQPRVHQRVQGGTKTLGSLMPVLPQGIVPYLFLAAPLALYFFWIIGPTIYSFYLSLTRWEGLGQPEFIGLANYQRLFGIGRRADRDFQMALINNARWLVVFITVPTTMGLGLAMVFNSDMRGSRWYKISFYAPLILSLPVIGLVWLWLYNPQLGLINSLLRNLGMANPPGWIADRDIAIWCVIAAAIWRQVGYVMVLYLAGLKNVDPTLIDAAMVDGAGGWPLFRRVIFPLLAPVTTIIIVISIIDSLRAFDLVQVMTRGNQNTEVLANMMYMEAFNNYNMGYGAAIAVVLFGISLIFIGFYLSRVIKDELEY